MTLSPVGSSVKGIVAGVWVVSLLIIAWAIWTAAERGDDDDE